MNDGFLQIPDGGRIFLHDNCSIGRSSQNDLAIADDSVSRRHAIINRDEGQQYWLTDLESSNGTYLNGRRVKGPARLNDNDRIELGSYTLHFGVQASLAPALSALVDALMPSSGGGNVMRHDVTAGASQSVAETCQLLRRALRNQQLVFCTVQPGNFISNALLETNGTAVNILGTDYRRTIVLDAREGQNSDKSFDFDRFYTYTLHQMQKAFGLDLLSGHHEQDIIQLLRDETQILLCLLNLEQVPTEVAKRLRSLTQEGHRTVVLLDGNQPDVKRRLEETSDERIIAADDSKSQEALMSLFSAYWHPVYVYVSNRVGLKDKAKELTQNFFTFLLKNIRPMLHVSQPNGRFRSFVLGALKRFMDDELNKSRNTNRVAGEASIPIGVRSPKKDDSNELGDELNAEQRFDRIWFLTVFEKARNQLRDEYLRAGKGEFYDALKSCIESGLIDRGRPTYAAIASRLGMTENVVAIATHRMRRRLSEILRMELQQTVSNPAELDAEFRHLVEVIEVEDDLRKA